MDNADNMQNMGEEILNAVTVIYGLFKLGNNRNFEYERIVEEQVRIIVIAINKNIFGGKNAAWSDYHAQSDGQRLFT